MVRIINDHGTMLIDADVPPLALRQRATLTANPLNNTYPAYDLPNAVSPVFAVRSTSGVYLHESPWVGSARSARFKSEYNSGAATVVVYAFDRVTDSGANWGMKLWNAQGQLIFDALRKFGRIVGELNSYGTWTGTAGRTYAAVVTGHRSMEEVVMSPLGGAYRYIRVWNTGVVMSGASVTLRDVLANQLEVPSGAPVGITKQFGAPSALILDVTGY